MNDLITARTANPATSWRDTFTMTYLQAHERLLNELLTSTPSHLRAAILYSAQPPGKVIRPLLLLATSTIYGTPVETLLPAAVALELMHCYSLVHDDLPAMDDDDLRRGQPTCHLQFDEATAVLVGDSLQALAYQALLQTPISAEGKVALVQRLSEASGPSGMVGGQMLDMLASAPDAQLLTQTELQQLHQLKTGQLIECALAMGSIVGRYYDPRARTDQSDPKAAHLLQFAQAIGLAFQVQDDILDETGSTTALGKTAGSDQRANKSTYPRLLGLSGAKELLHQLYTRAQGHLKAIQGDTQALDELATQIVERHH